MFLNWIVLLGVIFFDILKLEIISNWVIFVLIVVINWWICLFG